MQRTDVLESDMAEMRTLVRNIENTSLERANQASSQILREVQTRFQAQDDMINENKMEIRRKNDALHEMSAAWGQQIEALSRKDHENEHQYGSLRATVENEVANLGRKIRDLESIGFRQHTQQVPQGGTNPREYLGLVYGLREDVDNLRNTMNQKLSQMNIPQYQPPKSYTPPPAQQTVVREIVHHTGAAVGGGSEHYLGGGAHDAALVLWDEIQQQAQWEQIRTVQEQVTGNTKMLRQMESMGSPSAMIGNAQAQAQKSSSREVDAMASSVAKLRDHVRALEQKIEQQALKSPQLPSGRDGRDGRDGKDAKDTMNLKRDVEGHQSAIAILEKRVHDLERGDLSNTH